MNGKEIADAVLKQIDSAGFDKWGTNNIYFVKGAGSSSGFGLNVSGKLWMNWMDNENFCPSLDKLSIEVKVTANNRAGGIVLSTVDMKLKSGDEVDAGFFTGLVQEALEKAAVALGELASIAAVGAMTGTI
jgi:hypothetical protein